MKSKLLFVVALACFVGSCGEAPQEKEAAKGPPKLAAGKWLIAADFESADGTGLPPEAIEGLKQELMIGDSICVQEDEVDRPPPRFFTASEHQCSYDRLQIADGRIDASLICGEQDYSHVVEISGTYGPATYEIRENHQFESVDGSRLSLVLSGRARWSGNC
ncbi:MAG: DUF3617 domain-containing protein [Sphingomicrobium sp.]